MVLWFLGVFGGRLFFTARFGAKLAPAAAHDHDNDRESSRESKRIEVGKHKKTELEIYMLTSLPNNLVMKSCSNFRSCRPDSKLCM